MHPDKVGKIAEGTPSVLISMGLTEGRWAGQVRGTESLYWRAIGSADSLIALAEDLGQLWMRGIRAVTALERSG